MSYCYSWNLDAFLNGWLPALVGIGASYFVGFYTRRGRVRQASGWVVG
jgi:hypothetical protein